MRRLLDTRLVRIAKTEAPRDLMEARHRSLLRGRAALSALLCERSTPPYDGRACAAALQLGETAAVELAGIPDTPELRESDEARLVRDHAGAEETFEARLWHAVRQHRDGCEPDPANASPAELLAAYVAAPTLTLPRSRGREWEGGEGS